VHKPDRIGALCARQVAVRLARAEELASVPDLMLAGTARDLELAAVDCPAVMRRGYFGTGERWEGRGWSRVDGRVGAARMV